MKTEANLSREIVSTLIENLAATKPRITDLVQTPIPSCASIADIITTLTQILFPGFCDSQSLQTESLANYLEINIDKLSMQISDQIAIAFALDHKFSVENNEVVFDQNIDTSQFEDRAKQMADEFVQGLPAIRELLSTDIQAAYDGDPACRNVAEVILCYPGMRAVLVHRAAHQLYRLKIPFLPRMMAEWVHSETGIDIHPGARIGKYFFIDHGTGVVIGQTCEIGDHVKIYQGVTLGALSFPTDGAGDLVRDTKRHPTIQDNVVIYANATVLGGRTVIGHDSVLGSSVWITSSAEPFTTVIMEKPRLRHRDETPGDFQPPMDYQI